MKMKLPSFDLNSIYEHETWTVRYHNAQGYQQKFLKIVQEEIELSDFPNLHYGVANYTTGQGWFRKEETTPMLFMKASKSNFKKYTAFFRAQVFGNIVVYSLMECIESGIFDRGLKGHDRYYVIRGKCKNHAQYEEFLAMDNLSNIIFENAIKKLDPEYRDRKALMHK